MKHKLRKKYEARALVVKALAHPSRLLLPDLLKQQEICVSDLAKELGLHQSTVSKHLAILKHVGLVSVREQGASSYYRVACDCLDGFLSCLESVLQADLMGRRFAAR